MQKSTLRQHVRQRAPDLQLVNALALMMRDREGRFSALQLDLLRSRLIGENINQLVFTLTLLPNGKFDFVMESKRI